MTTWLKEPWLIKCGYTSDGLFNEDAATSPLGKTVYVKGTHKRLVMLYSPAYKKCWLDWRKFCDNYTKSRESLIVQSGFKSTPVMNHALFYEEEKLELRWKLENSALTSIVLPKGTRVKFMGQRGSLWRVGVFPQQLAALVPGMKTKQVSTVSFLVTGKSLASAVFYDKLQPIIAK